MRAASLNITKSAVLRILKEHLGNSKLCARLIAQSSTAERSERRVTSCQDITAMADTDKNFFNEIITGNETWCFACDPETERLSSVLA
jgi:hypothetical protein